jgi:tRNA nucleotidyltransferase (CCA-adding enzyme)
LKDKLGEGHIGVKQGHYFWVSPDKNYIIDLTGDQDAFGPVKWAAQLQDAEDEPFQFEPEQMRHRPGPIIYTPATNPLYKGFRVKEYSNPNARAELFAERANAALEGNLTKQADSGGSGSDAYPGEGPQAEEEFNLRDFHDPVIDDLNLSMEEPVEREYKFFFGNGEFKVSPVDDHETMAQEAQIPPDHTGPMAVGYVNVRGRDALWSVESNIGLRGLVKMMKDYSKQVGWKWGGLVDGSGQPIHDDFGAKKSYWYGWRDGELKLSAQPFWGSFDEIEVVGRTASFNREPNPFALPGLQEWAKDFGFRLAEYPGGDKLGEMDRFWEKVDEQKNGPVPGTKIENNEDMRRKGRGVDPPKMDGERNPSAKLTTVQVEEIIQKYAAKEGNQYQLAREYGVSQSTVSKIVKRELWASYPGGTDMNDRMKNKEWPTTYDKGDPEADPGKAFEGEPQGELDCPICGEVQPNFKAYVMHTQDHRDPEMQPIDDGHFPTIRPLDEPLGFGTQSQPTAIPVMGAIQQDSWHFSPSKGWGFKTAGLMLFHHAPSEYRTSIEQHGVQPGQAEDEDEDTPPRVYWTDVADPQPGIDVWQVHMPELQGFGPDLNEEREGENWFYSDPVAPDKIRRIAAGGKEGKDLLQAPIPFIYDIERDFIIVGHPGMHTHEIMGQFTPGGIVEGYYEKGGKMIINTTTTIPFSTFHMMQLWYYSHPGLEITSLEIENQQGDTHKVASADVGTYIRSITAADGAAWTASQALKEAGGKVYVVGGAVRDALLQKEPKDIDLMVSGIPPEDVNNILEHLPGRVDLTGKRFGVYRYHTKGQEVEIALPRTDTYEAGGTRGQGQITVDHHLPIEKDLQRRDFTANSMAVDLDSGRLVDPFGGARDIESHALRTTHPDVFDEDPTRLVRALTMHARHGLIPDEQTRKEMEEHAHRLDQESPDALKQQLEKFLVSANPASGVRLAHETGVLKHLFPELNGNWDFDQANAHHNYSLGEHSANVLDKISQKTKDPDLRLAAMLHDVGKPASAWMDPSTGQQHFYPGMIDGQPVGADHARLGADMAEARLRETFNYPVSKIRNIHNLISGHMFPQFSSPKGARKFLAKAGDAADDLLTLREADNEGKGIDTSYKTPVDHMRGLVEQVRTAGDPTSQSAISVNGNDLIAMGLKPGPAVGRVLRNLTDEVVANPASNDRETLLDLAREYIRALPEQ